MTSNVIRHCSSLIVQSAGNENSLAALLLNERLDLLGVLILVQVGDQEIGTLAGIGDCNGPADATIALVIMDFIPCSLPESL